MRAQVSRARFNNLPKERIRKMRGNGIDITLEQWEQLQEEADGRCALCGNRARLYVDHDHATGQVRGLLCNPCNTGLGKFGDDPARLEAAATYLRRAS